MQGAQAWITVLSAITPMPGFIPRKHSPDGASQAEVADM